MSNVDSYICIHGHFYQPPRENPWLETIEEQPSAAPYHDWNERVNAECYHPNTAARILDDRGYIKSISNNYSSISFNFGPTLLSWLEDNAPETYAAIIDADAKSSMRFNGHGSALAQVYSHIIMPLANDRDKHTQVRWGITDFRLRFGRMPEGMWLAECAVDTATLEALAAEDIKFTILSPYQALRVRSLDSGSSVWKDVSNGSIDTTMPYIFNLPSGRSIAIFFYNHIISQAVAFEGLLGDGKRFGDSLMKGVGVARMPNRSRLINIATDGESYGHHHKFGEMALAYAIDYIEKSGRAKMANYGMFLELCPPMWEVELKEPSSWSCSHGVERWRSNCGCNLNNVPGWTQEWRSPLREALNWLRDAVAPLYEYASRNLLQDPWEARDAYISVINDSSRAESFIRRYAPSVSMEDEQVRLLRMMEIQRHLQLMFTSCGWFFDDLSGIETVQLLRYAGRVLDLVQKVFKIDLEPEFKSKIAAAKSNKPEEGNGNDIYERYVKTAWFSFAEIIAQRCFMELFGYDFDDRAVRSFSTDLVDVSKDGPCMFGRCVLNSRITRGSGECEFIVVGQANFDVICAVRNREDGGLENLIKTFTGLSEEDAKAKLKDYFDPARIFTLKSLRSEALRRVLGILSNKAQTELRTTLYDVYQKNKPLLFKLKEFKLPLQINLRALANFAVNDMVRQEIEKPGSVEQNEFDTLAGWFESGKIVLDEERLTFLLRNRLIEVTDKWSESPYDLALLNEFTQLAKIAQRLPFQTDCTHAQDVVWRHKDVYGRMKDDERKLFARLGDLLKVNVGQA